LTLPLPLVSAPVAKGVKGRAKEKVHDGLLNGESTFQGQEGVGRGFFSAVASFAAVW